MSDYYKVAGDYHVPRQVIEDLIMEAGIGINYWAESMRIHRDTEMVTVKHDQGGRDAVSFQDIAEALGILAMEGYPAEYALLTGHEEELDVDVADRVIQMAVLGELVYG